jgi:transketolase
LQEGQIWEAAMFASAHKVDNLIATIDANGQQIDGATDDVLPMGSIQAKFDAFGWSTLEVANGNDMASVLEGFAEAKKLSGQGKPVAIILKTDMGAGVDFMAGTHEWHGIAPNEAQLADALGQLEETLGDY